MIFKLLKNALAQLWSVSQVQARLFMITCVRMQQVDSFEVRGLFNVANRSIYILAKHVPCSNDDVCK